MSWPPPAWANTTSTAPTATAAFCPWTNCRPATPSRCWRATSPAASFTAAGSAKRGARSCACSAASPWRWNRPRSIWASSPATSPARRSWSGSGAKGLRAWTPPPARAARACCTGKSGCAPPCSPRWNGWSPPKRWPSNMPPCCRPTRCPCPGCGRSSPRLSRRPGRMLPSAIPIRGRTSCAVYSACACSRPPRWWMPRASRAWGGFIVWSNNWCSRSARNRPGPNFEHNARRPWMNSLPRAMVS